MRLRAFGVENAVNISYFKSSTDADRVGNIIKKGRSRKTLYGVYQVVGRALPQYGHTPEPKFGGDIAACLR